MRALYPTPSADPIDLHDWYGRDWLEPGGLRVNFVSSVDGGVSADGRSAGLQTPGDNAVFATLRDLADVVLVGAGTARTEGYRPTALGAERTARRVASGLAGPLPTALVSRSLTLDPTSALIAAASPAAPTIVVTCAAADPDVRAALTERVEVIICGDDEVDLVAARRALAERGLRRILCEGGPSLFGDLVRVGAVDELCLSSTPLLVGPGPARIMNGAPWSPAGPRRLELTGLLEEEGALFARYRVDPTS